MGKNLLRALGGLCGLIILVAAAGFIVHTLWQQPKPRPPKIGEVKKSVQKPPVYEVYPKEKSTPPPPKPAPEPHRIDRLPRVAIILDDMGYDGSLAKRFLALDATLTYSVLPYSPLQNKIAKDAHEKGCEVMLHLPMEPVEYPVVDPGPGALLTSMSPDELIAQLEKNLNAVPFISGVNNHMGSKMTTHSTQLYQIFSVLKKKGLFFIDSRTSAESLCGPSARLFQVPFAERAVFLDHIQESEEIRSQIHRLIRIAIQRGGAIGIGHPHPETYNVLRTLLPELKKQVHLAPASRMVDRFEQAGLATNF